LRCRLGAHPFRAPSKQQPQAETTTPPEKTAAIKSTDNNGDRDSGRIDVSARGILRNSDLAGRDIVNDDRQAAGRDDLIKSCAKHYNSLSVCGSV
jgi:hypothetical protein